MRQTKSVYFCDDCRKEVSEADLAIKSLDGIDLCFLCLTHRIKHSLKVKKLGSTECKECNHTGQVKDFYGPHNDYNWKDCSACEGTGRVKLF